MTSCTTRYIQPQDIDAPEYIHFLESFHGEGTFSLWRKYMLWYWQLGDNGFRVLTAKRGDEYIGQACAYRVRAFVNGTEQDLWWGVDNFVIAPMRGKGVGKLLQSQLHRDLRNFSSAWYAPANNTIKRQCGAHGIMTFSFGYYPVSSYFSILMELAMKQLISMKISVPRIRIPWIYSMINSPRNKGLNNYKLQDIDLVQLPSLSNFIEGCLKDKEFHVIRSEQYLQWKYVSNPRTRCRAVVARNDDTTVGLIVFSEILEQKVVHAMARVVKVYDILSTPTSGLTYKHLLYMLSEYLHKRGERIDGFKLLQNVAWHPSLLYPKNRELLSTLNVGELSSGYITYIDQDMEG